MLAPNANNVYTLHHDQSLALNFRESIPFILLGSIASCLKFEVISRKIRLVFFFCDGTWYAWTFSLPSTWLQLPWWKIVRCFKSGLHCTRYTYIAFKAQKLLEDSEVLHVYSNRNFYVRNHVSQKAKGEILSNWDAIANRETAIQVQVMFSAKQHPDCRHRWPEINCDKADGHSQTGNRKKKMSASWIRKTSRKNKSSEKRL